MIFEHIKDEGVLKRWKIHLSLHNNDNILVVFREYLMLGFEFVMLANHDKTWQKLSLISLEWSTLKPKTKNSSLG